VIEPLFQFALSNTFSATLESKADLLKLVHNEKRRISRRLAIASKSELSSEPNITNAALNPN
jgi:hypothetical protein